MLSIDITDRQIKLVRGVHSGNKIRVQDADMRELSLGMISNGYVTDVPMVAAELNDIIKTKDIKEKEAIVSITSSSIVYKEMVVAKPKNMKNPAIIEAMIQSNMNVSNDFNISFTIAGETEDEEKNKMLKVIAAACPQRLVDGYVRLFSHIGLQLRGVNISNNSVTRLILNTPKMSDRMPILLIQIDKNFLNMNLYEDNQLSFSRFFNIDPNDYENAPDYVTRAVYDNLFRMIQFIRSRKGAKPLQEILFYGEIDSFIEITNAISSFNVPTNMLSMPGSIASSVQFDFSKYANAIGALYRRNKELEHINLLEATSAKESKGGNGFLLGLLGAMVASAAVVGGAVLVCDLINNNYTNQINNLQAKIDDPQMQHDLTIVDERDAMLAGFNSYNDTVKKTSLLFDYMPKPQRAVFDKVREPLDSNDDKLLTANEELEISEFTIAGYTVTVSFKGLCKGDPSSVPSRYAEYLSTKVLNKYGDPYFVNINYSGFTKDNITDWSTYATLVSNGSTTFDTVFSFEMTMQLQMGSDEENATLDLNAAAAAPEVNQEVTE
ncbi:MAG: pilus assembly protein PilM [Lachnospiraceae bacterium]|nr:pilus assembly protein PilM [Ruminococcus sp.]MCM1276123.1 pilus assembly protein PilM [Lachnospiraceae bacterium]